MPGTLGHAFPGLSARNSPSILLPDVGSFKPLHALMTAAMVYLFLLNNSPRVSAALWQSQGCARVFRCPLPP